MDASPILLHREPRIATLTIDRPPLNILDIPTIDRLGETDRRAGGRSRAAGDRPARRRRPRLLGRSRRAGPHAGPGRPHARQPPRHDPPAAGPRRRHHRRRPRPLPGGRDGAGDGLRPGDRQRRRPLRPARRSSSAASRRSPRRCSLPGSAPASRSTSPSPAAALTAEEAERMGLVTRADRRRSARRAGPGDRRADRRPQRPGRAAHQEGRSRRPRPPLPEALAETERIYKEELLPLADVEEGAAAFLEKRRPVWKHR